MVQFPKLSARALEIIKSSKLIKVNFERSEIQFLAKEGLNSASSIRFDAPVSLIEDMILNYE